MRKLIFILFCLKPLFAFPQDKSEQISLYFDSNVHTLDTSEKTKLDFFFSNKDLVVSSVTIDGFCDDVGTEDANLVLSAKRAAATAEYLSLAYDIKTADASGKGEIGLDTGDAAKAEAERKAHRKVTVSIRYTTARKPEIAEKPTDPTDNYEGYKTTADSLFPGDKMIIRHLIFKSGRTVFEDDQTATAELEKLVAYFKNNPGINFEVNGHVCCITNSFWDARDLDSGKNNLSETRAKRIYDYFAERGIDKKRMSYKGYGRKFPRQNVAESLNKRVEIVIVKI